MSIGPGLIRVFPVLSFVLISSAVGSLSVSLSGMGGAAFIAENALAPLAVALGNMSMNLSKYGQPLLRYWAMALLDCITPVS